MAWNFAKLYPEHLFATFSLLHKIEKHYVYVKDDKPYVKAPVKCDIAGFGSDGKCEMDGSVSVRRVMTVEVSFTHNKIRHKKDEAKPMATMHNMYGKKKEKHMESY